MSVPAQTSIVAWHEANTTDHVHGASICQSQWLPDQDRYLPLRIMSLWLVDRPHRQVSSSKRPDRIWRRTILVDLKCC